jgi:drug/metabolite transporter (DMT)-like permease
MIGELLALLSAFCFAFSGAAIAKGAPGASGDNGALLSIVLTAVFGGLIWALMGARLPEVQGAALWAGLGWFVLSGILSTVLGRTTMFRSIALAGVITASLFRRLIPFFGALLAVAILGEMVSAIAGFGMVLIFISLGVVVARELSRAPSSLTSADQDARIGHLYGVASAACYGSAYVVRKLGLNHLPDPALGGMIGAIAGLAWYALAAPFNLRHRTAITGLIATTGRWQFAAASAMSAGQISVFFALSYTNVATVAIIGALDIFIAAWLAAFVLRTEPVPGPAVIFATALATMGVVLVALH